MIDVFPTPAAPTVTTLRSARRTLPGGEDAAAIRGRLRRSFREHASRTDALVGCRHDCVSAAAVGEARTFQSVVCVLVVAVLPVDVCQTEPKKPQDEKSNAVISTSASSLSSLHVIQRPLRLICPCRFPLQRLFAFLAVVSINGVHLTSRTLARFYFFSTVPRLSPCPLPRPLLPSSSSLSSSQPPLLLLLQRLQRPPLLRLRQGVVTSFFRIAHDAIFVLLLSSASLSLSSSSSSSSSSAPLRPLGPLRASSSSSSRLVVLFFALFAVRQTFAPKIAVTSLLATWTSSGWQRTRRCGGGGRANAGGRSQRDAAEADERRLEEGEGDEGPSGRAEEDAERRAGRRGR